jgi:hypothetical protein
VVAAGTNGSAWIAGLLTAPLLAIPSLTDSGSSFAVEVAATANGSYAVNQSERFGGLPVTNPAYASLPLTLASVSVDPVGEAVLGGSVAPTASSSLLASEMYDLALLAPAALPSTIREAETSAASCTGSLCSGSAAYLAKLVPTAGASIAVSTDAAPLIVLRNLGSEEATNLTINSSQSQLATTCSSTLAAGQQCDAVLASAASGTSPGGSLTLSFTSPSGSVQNQSASYPAFDSSSDGLVFSPKELDFGIAASSGTPPKRTITVTNLGGQA